MTSRIFANNIDITYPIAGQDNDTQGFRTNFTNIRNNLTTATAEITELQSWMASNVANVTTIQTTISNVVYSNATPTSTSDIGVAGSIAYDSTHIYVCVATDSWLRANLSSW